MSITIDEIDLFKEYKELKLRVLFLERIIEEMCILDRFLCGREWDKFKEEINNCK